MALGGRNVSAVMLDELTGEQVAALSLADLRALQIEVDIATAIWKARLENLQAGLDKKYGEAAAALRLADGKDTGTVHIPEGGLDIACELQKKVEWDQSQLEGLWTKIAAAGDDPAVYMQRELKIKEATFTGWPEGVKAAFSPARTVKPQKPKYIISDPAEKKTRGRR